MIARMIKNLCALALLLSVASIAWAQQGAVKGIVKSKQSENDTPKPLEGATVEIFRLDITQKFQTKSDKKGEFYHSLPAFGQYIVSVSAPNHAPVYSGQFKVSGDTPIEQNFELVPGDGSKRTLEEIKAGAKNAAAGPADPKKAAEEAAKADEERNKIIEKNKKIEEDFKSVKQHFDAGLAFNQKNDYPNAIKEFKEAIAVDDAQPTIMAQLSQAYYNLGAVKFNAKAKDEARESFTQAAVYGEKAVKLDGTSPTYFKLYADACDILFKNFGGGDYGDKAIAAYTTGSDLETDKAKKAQMINKIGSIYFNRADFDKCAATYDKVLAMDPDNLDALKGKASIILATTQTNTTPEDKAKLEQAMNIFQTVYDKLPAGAAKTEVEGYISYLKDTMKIEVKKDTKKKDDKKKK